MNVLPVTNTVYCSIHKNTRTSNDPKEQEININNFFMIGQKTFFIFFIVALIMQFLFQVNINIEIYLLLLGWLIYSYVSQSIVKKRKIEFKLMKKIEFINYILCLIFITAIFYYSGSILWIGPIFFIFIILYASILIPPIEGMIITFLSFAFCTLIISLEYLGYISPSRILRIIFISL